MITQIRVALLRWRMRQIDRQWRALNRDLDCYEYALKDARGRTYLRRIVLMMQRQALLAQLETTTHHNAKMKGINHE